MKKLGYIVTKSRINGVVDHIGIVDDISKVEDPTLPILLIGYNNAKKRYGESFSILSKSIYPNEFWTFGKMERRVEYDRDLSNFCQYVIDKSISDLEYHYIDIFTVSYSMVKKLILLLHSSDPCYIYLCGFMIYIYDGNGKIYGLSTKIMKYAKIDIDRIYRMLYKCESNVVRTSDSFVNSNMKKVLNNKRYAMAYFISMLED